MYPSITNLFTLDWLDYSSTELQQSEDFCIGLIYTLCHTKYCLFYPDGFNQFTHIAFEFPVEVSDNFLHIFCNSMSQLSEAEIVLTKSQDETKFCYYSADPVLISKLSNYFRDWVTTASAFKENSKFLLGGFATAMAFTPEYNPVLHILYAPLAALFCVAMDMDLTKLAKHELAFNTYEYFIPIINQLKELISLLSIPYRES